MAEKFELGISDETPIMARSNYDIKGVQNQTKGYTNYDNSNPNNMSGLGFPLVQ